MNLPAPEQLSVCAAVIAAGLYGVAVWWHELKFDLGVLLSTMFTGGAVPAGFFLIYYSFFPNQIQNIGGFSIYLLGGGVAVLVVSTLSIWGNCQPKKPAHTRGAARPDATTDS